jgi:hypothetical protein
MAPPKRKKKGIGRKYKAGTHGVATQHGDGSKRRAIASSNNLNGRGRGETSQPDDDAIMITPTGGQIIATSLDNATTTATRKPPPIDPNQPRFNNQIVDFASVESRELDPLSFARKKNGTTRNQPAARKALSRATNSIIDSITKVGDEQQQAFALHKALAHPKLQTIAKTAGFNPAANETARYTLGQISRALDRSKEPAFDQAMYAAMAPSAVSSPQEVEKNFPSHRKQLELLGVQWDKGRDKLKRGTLLRQLNKTDSTVQLTKVPKRNNKKQITKAVISTVRKWITEHPMVVDSPISNDTLKIHDEETGKKTKTVGKLLLQIPIRELHNDLVLAAEKGDLPGLLDLNGRIVVSDTSLRNILPPQLRRATERHKQMCGCETCLTPRSHQQSLNSWRDRHLRQLKENEENELVVENKIVMQQQYTTYKGFVRPEGRTRHGKPHHAVLEIMCAKIVELGHHNWSCVLRRCELCPKFPIPAEESKTDDEAPTINFHHYVPFTKCSKHGPLVLRAKVCNACEELQENEKKGKLQTRKELTLLCRKIGIFHRDYYLPALEKFAYHTSHVTILSKQEEQCGSMRMNNFLGTPGCIKTIRDYAERLLAKFNLEVQSSHFGNGRSLSMEGSTALFYLIEEIEKYQRGEKRLEDIRPIMQSHSHFSDDSRQDASTTFEHTSKLIEYLKINRQLVRGAIVYTDTDGCGKQYRCGNSIYLNSLLSSEHGIIIDHAVGAPGHGKDVVDGINAIDKRFLAGKMCLIGTPEANDRPKLMQAASMIENATKSLAGESVRLCREETRVSGVKGYAKHAKREANAPLKERHYHLHKTEEIRFKTLKMKADGLLKGAYNGIGAMYNFRTEPELGLGRAAARRIPCGCTGCMTNLSKEWKAGVPAEKQDRYGGSETCKWWAVFQGLNDWTILTLNKGASTDDEDLEESMEVALRGIAIMNAERMVEGEYGAFMTDDPDADGYYVVTWTSPPYTLQEDLRLEEYMPAIIIEKGELVCNALYWSKVRGARRWYVEELESTTVVRVKQVVAPKVVLYEISVDNKLPNNCNKRAAAEQQAKRIALAQHETILDEISRRELLDYDEEVRTQVDEAEEQSSLSSSDDDDNNSAAAGGESDDEV